MKLLMSISVVLVLVVAEAACAQGLSEAPTHASIYGTCTAPGGGVEGVIPAQEELTPGRYWDPHRPGQGWDFFWYTQNEGGSTQALDQKLFTVWYTHRDDAVPPATGTIRPIWYGATGDVVINGAGQRIGWDGEIWEFSQVAFTNGGWGIGSGSSFGGTQLPGGKRVGWIRLGFSTTSTDNNPDKLGVWWKFDQSYAIAGGNYNKSGTQCLTNFGKSLATPPGSPAPLDGKSGTWAPDQPKGWALMSYFYRTEEQQILLYMDGAWPPSSSQPPTPRWAHAVGRFWKTHPCDNLGYESIPEDQPPTESDAALCLLEVVGHPPDLVDNGWDPVTGNVWKGTLFRNYQGPDPNEAFIRIKHGNPLLPPNEIIPSGSPLPINDSSLWINQGGGTFVHKVNNVHRIFAHKVVSPSGSPEAITFVNGLGDCPVHVAGDGQGLCELRLYWITNAFLQSAVYMHRLDANGQPTNERVLVRDVAPISPIEGYPYPPRGDALPANPTGGVAANERVKFELYRTRDRTELLATTQTIRGVPPQNCTAAPAVSITSPTNGGTVSPGNPTFQFNLAGSGRYRLRFFEGTNGASGPFVASYDSPGVVSGNVSVSLPNYVVGQFRDFTIAHSWTLQSIGTCGVGAPVVGSFTFAIPNIPDAAPGASAPSETSDTTPLVGSVPLEAGVDGGAATVSIPIEVPPGRHGMQPSLSLNYSSRAGNGIAGMGWSLSGSSSIHRCPKTLEQDGVSQAVEINASDRICLDGQRLVFTGPSGSSYGQAGAQYRTEIDQYLRVTQVGGDLASLGTTFTVQLRGSETHYYGGGTSNTVVAVPTDSGTLQTNDRILAWNLSRRQDAAGNTVDYAYFVPSNAKGETLLQSIAYTGFNSTPGNRTVTFTYASRPADASSNDRSSSFIAGARIDQTQRLIKINTAIAGTGVREYSLLYARDNNGATQSAYSGRSMLRYIKLCARDENGSNEKCLPRTLFDWQEQRFARAFAPLSIENVPNLSGITVPEEGLSKKGSGPSALSFNWFEPNATRDPATLNPGRLGSLTPVGDMDGDGTVEMISTVARLGEGIGAVWQYDTYLVKLNADRTVQASFLVPSGWVANQVDTYAHQSIDFNNDGRAEIWGVKPVNSVADPSIFPNAPANLNPRGKILMIYRWIPGSTSWAAGSFQEINTGILIQAGRDQIVPERTEPLPVGSKDFFVTDVDGDAKPDIVASRTPWGPADPLSTDSGTGQLVCPDDGITETPNLSIGGDVVVVYRNTSPDGVLSNISFGAAPVYKSCMDYDERSSTTPWLRHSYGMLQGTNDLNGDGIPDLSISRVRAGIEARVRFGVRDGTVPLNFWPRDFSGAGRYEVNLDQLGPGISDWEKIGGSNWTWIDVNGDGLNDGLTIGACNQGDIRFVRLNTGKIGKNRMLTDRIPVYDLGATSTPAPTGCQAFSRAGFRPYFQSVDDIDSDGRQELLAPIDFAMRVCTYAEIVVNPPVVPEPTDYTGYYCPEHPLSPDTNGYLPNEMYFPGTTTGPQAVFGMYGSEGRNTSVLDDSLYTMGALRFVDIGPDANGNPQLRAQWDNNTGIVMTALATQVTDVYGDGLTDHYGPMGCRFDTSEEPLCALLSSASLTNPAAPTGCAGARCNWGPTTLPNNTAASIENRGFYIAENVGAGSQAGQAPKIPDILSKITAFRSGDHDNDALRFSSWNYAPLSSKAGRLASDLPLYTIPARSGTDPNAGYVDAKHFYFTSSMPVVSEFQQSSATTSPHLMRYGYQEAMYHNQGRGFRGFRKIVTEDWTSGLRTTQRFHQKFPLVGLEDCRAVSLNIDATQDCVDSLPGTPISYTSSDWSHVACGGQCPPSVNAQYPYYQVTLDVTSSETRDVVTRQRATFGYTNRNYDEFGNVTTETTASVSASTAGTPISWESSITRFVSTTNEYTTDVASWWIDKLASRVVASELVGSETPVGGGSGTDELSDNKHHVEVFSWDASSRQVNCHSVLSLPFLSPPSESCAAASTNPYWESTTTTAFNSYGNPTQVSTTARGVAVARVTNTTYSDGADVGYFPKLVTSVTSGSSGLTTESAFDRRFGAAQSVIDPKGLITTTTYDVLGRQESVTPPNLSGRRLAPPQWTAYQWCTGNRCQTAPFSHWRVRTQQPGAPTQLEYFNRVGDSLRQERSGFGGETIAVSKQYDAQSRVVYQSEPSFISSSTNAQTTLEYDVLGRVTRKVSFKDDLSTGGGAGGSNVRTTYSYNGLTTNISVCRVSTPTGGCLGPEPTLVMSRTADAEGRILRTVDALGGVTRFRYDALGNPNWVADAKSAITTAEYDALGRRTSMNDPNRGNWQFEYNGLGELTAQADARAVAEPGNIRYKTVFSYDAIGRVVAREWRETDPENNSQVRCMKDTWVYDTFAPGLMSSEARTRLSTGSTLGNCTSVGAQSESFERVYNYVNPIGQPQLYQLTGITTNTLVSGTSRQFTNTVAYDGYYGRVKQEYWPGGVSLYRAYDNNGYVLEEGLAEGFSAYGSPSNRYLRKVATMTARDQVARADLNNTFDGSQETPTMRRVTRFDAGTGLPLEMCAQLAGLGVECNSGTTTATNAKILDIAYRFDAFGNVKRQTNYGRPGASSAGYEEYAYDALHRLTSATRTGTPSAGAINYGYDAIGNFRWKSDYSASAPSGGLDPYRYETAGKPHAVSSVVLASGGTVTFTYDANGNQETRVNAIGGVARRVKYDIDNLPHHTLPGENSDTGSYFRYGPDKQRYFHEKRGTGFSSTSTYYLGKAYELEIKSGGTQVQRYYLTDGVMVVRDNDTATNTSGTYFVHTDRLGSSSVMTNAAGQIVQKTGGGSEAQGFDAFGKTRNADWGDTDGRLLSMNPRGFTQHEHIDSVGLIHMNGRAYDYNLGRFLSVDPIIQFPLNSQSLNPYSYIMNNPFAGVDPTGYRMTCAKNYKELKAGESTTCTVSDTSIGARSTTRSTFVATANEKGDVEFHSARSYSFSNGATTSLPAIDVARSSEGGDEASEILNSTERGRLANAIGSAKDALELIGEVIDACPGTDSLRDCITVAAAGKSIHFGVKTVAGVGGRLLTKGRAGAQAQDAVEASSGFGADRAVQAGDRATYGELNARRRSFGEAEPLDMDHQPSFAAQKAAAERILGRPLTPPESRALRNQTPAVASPRAVHQQTSPTYGGRNTPTRVAEDSANLEAAEARDRAYFEDAMRER